MRTTKLFNDFAPNQYLNKGEIAKQLGYKCFDTAVSQAWLNSHPNLWDNGIIIWSYDDASVFGKPVNLFPLLLSREWERLDALLSEYPPTNPKVLSKWYEEALFQQTKDYIYDWQQTVERGGIGDWDIYQATLKLYKSISN